MKKILYAVMLIVWCLAIAAVSFAEEQGNIEKDMQGREMKSDRQKVPCGFGIMKMMQDAKLVATDDGGIIVMVGNKLLKYDRDLNLVKETGIKIDMEKMREKIMLWKEGFPMHKREGSEEEGKNR